MIKKWISATDLCEKWEIEPYDLYEIVIGSIEWTSDPQKQKNRLQSIDELYLDIRSAPLEPGETPLRRRLYQGRRHFWRSIIDSLADRRRAGMSSPSAEQTSSPPNINEMELSPEYCELIVDVGLQAYTKTGRVPIDQATRLSLVPKQNDRKDTYYLKDVLFLREQAESYGEKIGMPPLGSIEALQGKERQELGRLRREKERWDKSIDAAVRAGIYCFQKYIEDSEHKPTRGDIEDFLHKFELPKTTTDKIISAIPANYRQGTGAPKKNPQEIT